ncbi:unnamed protein product [Hyaloperonospora brassicae]|uniref:PH domain-containing protein n=1 Tax=Hyaloperonospora brassicae TaxID=162125 RepID=A0AAV0V0A2_HYABA|nr:unnamed protein product [Hyaloperonospora brassicae]
MPPPSQAPIASTGLPPPSLLSAAASSSVAGSSALVSSYLLKQSAGKWKRKRWNQRWVVLDPDKGVLRYFRYASPLVSLALRQDAHGVLSLKHKGVSLVVQGGDVSAGVPTPFCFSILHGDDGQQEVRLCADSDVEFRRWTTAIAAVIAPSSTGRVNPRDTRRAPLAGATQTAVSVSGGATVSPRPCVNAVADDEQVVETMNDVEGAMGNEAKPKQVLEQMCTVLRSNRTMLLALNPTVVLVRYMSISTWCLAALVANAVAVWLLWYRKVDPRKDCPFSRTSSRTLADTDAGDSGGAEDKPRTKLAVSSTNLQQTSSSSLLSKRATFLGKIDGMKPSAGASLKMGSAAMTESATGCWAHVDATRFDVRQGPNYRKTKLKAASTSALLELVAVDVYQSDVKVDNIGSIVNLSVLKPATGDLDLFIVNCQVPSYQPPNPLWGEKQSDGVGFNFVTYFAVPPAIREMLDSAAEPPLQAVRLLKDFMQPNSWASERFKAIGVVANPQEQQLGRAERHLLETYNGQPILTRPQHQFYRGDGYFEVDVNAHDFNYIARKGLVGISSHACNMVLDFGFVLEGQDDHELPEQILGCVRLCKVDVCSVPSLS